MGSGNSKKKKEAKLAKSASSNQDNLDDLGKAENSGGPEGTRFKLYHSVVLPKRSIHNNSMWLKDQLIKYKL